MGVFFFFVLTKKIMLWYTLFIASEPHLARQHEEMKNAWDQELEDIATESM